MVYSFFWMEECSSYSLSLKFAFLVDAKAFARALALSESVDIFGVDVYEEQQESSVRVYGVRLLEGKLIEF